MVDRLDRPPEVDSAALGQMNESDIRKISASSQETPTAFIDDGMISSVSDSSRAIF